MKKTLLAAIAMLMIVSSWLASASPTAAASNMTQYRVYQNDKLLKEFTTSQKAIAYAKTFSYSHVEKIGNREWVWDNFPKYKVYIDGLSTSKLEFATLAQATSAANTSKNAYVRDLENIGWSYNTFAKYQLYQGEKTNASWSFTTLAGAKKEAAKWGNAHIIDLSTNSWIWDNITDAQLSAQQAGQAIYMITVDDVQAPNTTSYAALKDAVVASSSIANSTVLNTSSNKTVYSNLAIYDVYSQGNLSKSYSTLDAAVAAAKKLYAAEVKVGVSLYWSSVPSLTVLQGERAVKSFHSLKSAINYANTIANSTIVNQDGRKLYSTVNNFFFMGWNGSSSISTINSHIANTQGLDIDSPTWYYLEDETGKLNDTSNGQLVKQMREQAIDIIPLVHNQFNRTMTSAFLKDEQAQSKFITALINNLVSIEAKGLNLDFEEVAGSDRKAFTSFVKKLTDAAHKQKLTVSIDMLRGDVAWNASTAYDHEEIGKVVDYVIIMAYDEHWKGSTKAGSVASLSWVEEGIKQYLNYGIPRNKLVLGIPFYVREWRIDGNGKLVDNKAILMKDQTSIIQQNNAVGVLDKATGQYKFTYQLNGYTHVFWSETEATIIERIKLAKKYELAGIAAWRLGYEDAALWEAILPYKSL